MTQSFFIRISESSDHGQITGILTRFWGAATIVSRNRKHFGDKLPSFVAVFEDKIIGLITYHFEDDGCQVVSLNSLKEKVGIGTALLENVVESARKNGCRRVWLITSNDNLNALGFYQKREFRLAALYPKAIDKARQLKPQMPKIGQQGIPLRDEILLELIL